MTKQFIGNLVEYDCNELLMKWNNNKNASKTVMGTYENNNRDVVKFLENITKITKFRNVSKKTVSVRNRKKSYN